MTSGTTRPARQVDKVAASAAHALAQVQDGAVVMIGGFGSAGVPEELLAALIERGVRDLTVVSNNAGSGLTGWPLRRTS